MSESNRIEGDRVYCHSCDHEWDRAHGGLQCPACASEFVEIVEPNSRPRPSSPPLIPPHPILPRTLEPSNPFHQHNPWAPDPDDGDITTIAFNTGGGRGSLSFTSRTYTIGGGGDVRTQRDPVADELGRNFEAMIHNIMGAAQHRPQPMTGGFLRFPPGRADRGFGEQQPGQPLDLFSMLLQGHNVTHTQRTPNQAPNYFDIIGAMLNPANARRGDTVFSQEAFDRVMTHLMEQNQSSAPGPASDTAIAGLKRKPVDESMMGSDGTAECSICMDNLQLGDEVTVLPCNHWFHGTCVISWLREHDTCPHCRKPITDPEATNNSPSSSRRRRPSRRSSSVASPLTPIGESNQRSETVSSDSPSGLREARQRYYGNQRTSDIENNRPQRERRSSDRSQRSADNNGGGSGGGVTGWLRNRLPFS